MLKKIVGGKNKKKEFSTSTEDAVQKLRLNEEIMMKRRETYEKKIDHETKVVKQNATTNKRVALQALRSKKLHEQKLLEIDNTLLTLEQQRESLENASLNINILNTLKDSADTLKSAHLNMNSDDVHEIIDDICEEHEHSKEISDAISSFSDFYIDEGELQKELEELVQDDKRNKLLKIETATITNLSTPKVPIFEPSTRSKTKPKKDDEMNKLADWAS